MRASSRTLARSNRRKAIKIVDALAYVAGVGGNLAAIPQIIKAWSSDAPGLAVTTWMIFVCIGLVWLAYAILHRQRPLIIANCVGISCSTAVVLGWMLNN